MIRAGAVLILSRLLKGKMMTRKINIFEILLFGPLLGFVMVLIIYLIFAFILWDFWPEDQINSDTASNLLRVIFLGPLKS